jgi:hypothetical protein
MLYLIISTENRIMNALTPFHLAIPVNDLKKSREFYGEILGCEEGRSSDIWIDFNFYGHQLVCHLTENNNDEKHHNPVDGKSVPVPHFGIVMEMQQWKQLRDKLESHNLDFVIEPYIRFEGQVGEQATMFLYDFCGNALEFKAFANIEEELFKK